MSRKRLKDPKDPNELYNLIKDWMVAEGQFIGDLKLSDAQVSMEIKIGDTSGTNVLIPKDKPNHIIIAHVILIPNYIRAELKNLDDKQFSYFWFDLYISLVKMGVDFQAVKTGKDVSSITINHDFVIEEIFITEAAVSKNLFFEKLSMIRRAILLVIHYFEMYSGHYNIFLGLGND